jgi:DNA mismatch repair protein MutL
MNRIHRLPDDIINKIAAGEVVERPASIVKELLENAVDAEARSIRVEITGGGKSRIRVRDDGHGMSRDDARAALERHATSKLRTFEDLQQIATHGFRGEALPSIASVSDLTLTTCEEDATAGTEIAVRQGTLAHVRDAGHPRGTTVEVSDLFGAVPARRKFLRSESTEASHVADALTLVALARPGIRMALISGGRTVIDAPPADGLEARLYQLFGERLLEDLVAVDGGADWARVRGFTSRPSRPGAGSRPNVRLFVNGRGVRDRALLKAVTEAYRAAGSASHAPEAFLFLEVPPHMVDVNVHPAKTEVRFADGRTPFVAVERAVREALSQGARTVAAPLPPRAAEVVQAVQAFLSTAAVHEAAPAFEVRPPAADEYVVLGQHRDVYIVCSDGSELVLIDQHTAHERVRFEALRARAEERTAESQGLLLPIVTALPPALREPLAVHRESLALLGYDIEGFGGDSVRITAVPALLGSSDPAAALLGILRDIGEREDAEWNVASARDRLAATLACHSAVRAGQRLAPATMAAIARELPRTEHPDVCPHGRPTLVRIAQDELSRWFGRTGWKRR